jgi:hypothetical protein
MSIISLIIKENFAKVRNKSFIVMTFKSAFVCSNSCFCRLFKFHESRYKANSMMHQVYLSEISPAQNSKKKATINTLDLSAIDTKFKR